MRVPKALRKNKGSSTTEYVLILTLVLGFFLFAFWGGIVGSLEALLESAGFSVKLPGPRKKKETTTSQGSDSSSGSSGGLLSGPGISYDPVPASSTEPVRRI